MLNTAITAILPRLWMVGLAVLPQAGVTQAQARLILNNNGWVRIDNGAWVVVMNPAPTGIQTLGTGGNIRSEGELNRVRWNVQGNTGTYTVPFTGASGLKIPVTCQVTGAGVGPASASLTFSTYNHSIGTDTWDNDLYRPEDVTHMNNWDTGVEPTPGATNESQHVVDRFWMIDPGTHTFTLPYAYVTKPSVTLSFRYDPVADIQAGNIITAASPLGAQRFNINLGKWGDLAPGIGAWSPGSVVGVNVPPAQFFRSWTLSDIGTPLPVELIAFEAECSGEAVHLRWTTASERNNDHFTVERSADGVTFGDLGRIEGAGMSTAPLTYSFTDMQPMGTSYYRLRQTDADGRESWSLVRIAGCEDGHTTIVNAWDDGTDLNVLVNAASDQEHGVRLLDAEGKDVWNSANVPLIKGLTTLRIPKNGVAVGIYVVRFDGPEGPMARRVALH